MDLPSSALGIASTAVVLLLGVAAVCRGVWRGTKRLVRIHDLIEKELNNNGGSSMKDQIESANRYAKQADTAAKEAVKVASETVTRLTDIEGRTLETGAMVMSHEREFGALTMRVKKLEESDEGSS